MDPRKGNHHNLASMASENLVLTNFSLILPTYFVEKGGKNHVHPLKSAINPQTMLDLQTSRLRERRKHQTKRMTDQNQRRTPAHLQPWIRRLRRTVFTSRAPWIPTRLRGHRCPKTSPGSRSTRSLRTPP